MKELEAVVLGCYAHRLEVWFRGVFFLAELAHTTGSPGRIAELVKRQNDVFMATKDGAREGVQRVEALLAKSLLPFPPRPRTLDDYLRWSRAAVETAREALPPDSPARTAFEVGDAFGELWACSTLARLFRSHYDATPGPVELLGHKLYGELVATCAHRMADATNRLEEALKHPALAARARPPGERVVAAARRAPITCGRDHLTGPAQALAELEVEIARFDPLQAETRAAFPAEPEKPAESWLVLLVPRTEGQPSGVLLTLLPPREAIVNAQGADMVALIDALLAGARERLIACGKPTLVVPLDGRHGLAGKVLEESRRRGWPFARHLPAGQARHLLDLDGPDAAPSLAADQVPALIDELGKDANDAVDAGELGEAMAIHRRILAVLARHFGWWTPFVPTVLQRLVAVAAQTGAADTVREASELVRHVVSQPMPTPPPNPATLVERLTSLAQNCARAGQLETSAVVLRVASRFEQGSEMPQP
jgi:hypothetical protein